MEKAGGGGAPPGDAAARARLPSESGAHGRSFSRRASAWPWDGSVFAGREGRLTRHVSLPRRLTWSQSTSTSQQRSPGELSDYHTFGKYSELFAAAVGNVEWLRFCINPDRQEILADDKGFTAIHLAAQRARLSCIQVLVEEYKFPVDLPTDDCRTPLHLVIHKDNKTMAVPCIDYLLQKGAAINSPMPLRSLLTRLSDEPGTFVLLSALSPHGGTLHSVTHNRSTPLHLAACDGMLTCMKVLVQNGADVHARDATGCKPIDYCKIWNHRSCARFLKDAMWKHDKKDFAREMEKLKYLKNKLMSMEQNYLIKHQKEQSIQRDTEFSKWLHSKKQCQPPISSSMQQARAQPQFFALSTTSGTKGVRHTVEARLQSLLLQPKILPKLFNPLLIHQRPKSWNHSSNPATHPPTDISCPQGIRLGVHPDPHREHDFSSFLEVIQDAHGLMSLHTVDGHWVAPLPQLPFKVIVDSLFPKSQPYRMKVPEGLHPISVLNLTQKRQVGQDTWIDSVTMNLRETFDEAFLLALQAQMLPSPPQSS
ncbi:ankyrin repeat domain-containing protein 53 [Dipodomys spectabilis]|uniref:ankyrin repeat domain-containing protein 53 n=1 Tax=Dipodomys spectabilis TaxID=105255 RepID=UPI001C538CE3|nr:ankyrin repeat domain-containing protein 53 [Dipodomys spectabilis]